MSSMRIQTLDYFFRSSDENKNNQKVYKVNTNRFRKRFFLLISFFIISQISVYSQVKVNDVNFSVQRGFYSAPFYVNLSCVISEANIKYTLDGSSPLGTSGKTYSSAISINKTTILRAAASRSDFTPSDIITHTYIFLDSVIKQPVNPIGFPTKWVNSSGKSINGDYEMDPEYPVNNTVIIKALKSLPSVSLVADPSTFFGNKGFHNNGSKNNNGQWESAASVEFIFGDSSENYQVNAGVQPRGSDVYACRKRGLRVQFKSEYGPGKLDFPLFKNATDTTVKGAKKFDTMILRPGFMENYTAVYNPFKNIYIRDPMIRDLQLNISGYGTHNLFVHTYFNGLYWGVYNICEEVEADMLTEYFGGKEEDWLITKSKSVDHATGWFEEGDPARFLEFMKMIDEEDFTKNVTYEKIQQYIDVKAFAEYMIIYNFWGVGDWPDNNWIFAICGGAKPIPGRFYSWDAEKTLLEGDDAQSYKHAWYSPYLTNPNLMSGLAYISPPSRVWRSLIKNSDFRMLFADRSYQLMSNNGRLTDANMIGWFDKYNNYIKEGIIVDQKRWSDDNLRSSSRSPGRIFTYPDVLAEINKVKFNITNNVAKYKTAFRTPKLYPVTEPPKFSQHGGKVQNNYTLTITNPSSSGIIYYTTDCTDPRLSGGTAALNAIKGNNNLQVAIQKTTTINARILKDGEWSPISDATFLTSTNSSGLILTEIMYNPEKIGDSDGDNYEFIELKNSGSDDINLSQYSFTAGIWYTFPNGTKIKPNQFVVLASDAEKFRKKYDFYPDGIYQGNLNNGGDSIVLKNPFSDAIISMAYNDSTPWPVYADSGKYSLVTKVLNLNPNPEKSESWRLSNRIGGSPGADDLSYEKQNYSGLLITEIMYRPVLFFNGEEELLEFIEIKNTGTQAINMAGVHFSDGIEYTFYHDKIIKPNEFIVLVKDNPAFFKKYGFYGYGEFAKDLSNLGETILFSDPYKNPIFIANYGIWGEWPAKTNGDGYSLVPVSSNTNAMPSNPKSWRASLLKNGSPGRDDATVVANQVVQLAKQNGKSQLKNFPNPFVNSTNISFTLEKTSDISLQVYNANGQLIKELLNQKMNKGEHNVVWNTSNNAPGIYLIQLQTPEYVKMHKCSLIR